tara:strand:- start:2400 stop:2642 length:243 start_codon:yes stop_codon:yes gene_type:complete
MGCNCGKSKKGSGLVIIKDYDSRMFICKQCPYSRENKITGLTCGKLLKPTYDDNDNQLTCGCILKLKAKLKAQRCPQGKW